jgi:hypothetical protein
MKIFILHILFLFTIVFAHAQSNNKKPYNLYEAIGALSLMHHESTKQKIISMTEHEFTVNSHFGLGLWIRNNWGLWQGSKLKDYFNSIGVFHPDEMSSIILTSYYRKHRDKDWDIDRYLKYYEDRWNEQKHFYYKIPDILPLREHDKN